MDKYQLVIVLESKYYIHFDMYVNGVLTNPQHPICMNKGEFDRFFKMLFRGSKGNCIRMYSHSPPTQFYP
ncbi:hypothetical protein JOC37_001866 [Desulfohalotomaculum tongense]|uniref:hypothetical protein n=1 Tax=Desulforadius tongensis TaxID=1216062 RepID=UPI001956F382|nr:hypothetical protein [Desulforadius tongensis]MBM7855469.1 hypothetical protein [Desulforadius tongensis]